MPGGFVGVRLVGLRGCGLQYSRTGQRAVTIEIVLKSTQLPQLRSGHSDLNTYLAGIRQLDSSMCRCGESPETTQHYLLHCKEWQRERIELKNIVGSSWGGFVPAPWEAGKFAVLKNFLADSVVDSSCGDLVASDH